MLVIPNQRCRSSYSRTRNSTSRGITALASLIPGFRQFADKYNITGEDIRQLLFGNSQKVIMAIAGSVLDHTFHWQPAVPPLYLIRYV
jgi:hypothetical protein